MVSEINDRMDRSRNVILFNVPESSERLPEDRVKEDLQHFCEILNPLGSFDSFPKPKKILRLGIAKPNVMRPIKLFFENSDEAMIK